MIIDSRERENELYMSHRYFKMAKASCCVASDTLFFICTIRVPPMSMTCPFHVHVVFRHHRKWISSHHFSNSNLREVKIPSTSLPYMIYSLSSLSLNPQLFNNSFSGAHLILINSYVFNSYLFCASRWLLNNYFIPIYPFLHALA